MHLPLHLFVSERLREQIINGQLQPSEQLPSEHQLMAAFGVSRITVRRAITNLVNQGLVVVQQGKGAFVKEQRKVIHSLSNPLIFYEEDMARQGVTSAIQTLVFEPVIPPPEVRSALNLESTRSKVYLQKKLLLLNGDPVGVDITYILPNLGKNYAKELQTQMTFPVLEKNGITIDRIEATLECTHADHEISQYLTVPLGSPLLVYCHTAYTVGNQPILHGKAVSRGDRLCYSVVLHRNSNRGVDNHL
ncbi:GntR family transcriptional regulator [filamentous cyanobacterium CCP2]|nr:GntR family transcriptional regulator [filamentous cyanobacterium CCP2]